MTYPARKYARHKYISGKKEYMPIWATMDKQTEVKRNLLDQQADDLTSLINSLNVLGITIKSTFETINEKLETTDENLQELKMKIEDE